MKIIIAQQHQWLPEEDALPTGQEKLKGDQVNRIPAGKGFYTALASVDTYFKPIDPGITQIFKRV